jgi:chloramphenicol-sensitive protein RarD
VDDERLGFLSGLAAYVLWGLLTLYWHELTGLSAFGLIAWRVVWSVVILAGALTVLRRWPQLRVALGPEHLLATSIAAVALAVNWTTYVWCVTHGRVVDTALGYFLAPIAVILAGVFGLHEPLRRAQGVALALCGVAVVVFAVGSGTLPWFALIIAASWTVYGVCKKLVPLAAVEGLAAEALVLFPASMLLLVAMQASGSGSLEGASTLQVVLIPLTGVVTTVPLLLFAFSARRVRLTTLGWLQYAVPTINLVLGVAVYEEAMPAWRVAGFAIVWLALAIITVDGVRASRSAAPVEPLETDPVPAAVPLEG